MSFPFYLRPVLYFVLPALLFPAISWSQQEGCTDSLALNYDSNAVINDGSCTYADINLNFRKAVLSMPETISESSGLILWRNSYWTHNDSGGTNEIYSLDSITGHVKQIITLKDATNVDWEDLTHDQDYIYVGDFGNNYGNRSDLCVYKVAKNDIPFNGDTIVACEKLSYSYADQSDFTIRNLKNDYDCEAIVSLGDSLYLFTKNWANFTTRLYALPKRPGSYYIYPIDEYNINGLVTGAVIDVENRWVVLCGYHNYIPFIVILNDYWRNDFFGGNKRRINFKNNFATQTEGIAYTGNNTYAISSERTIVRKAKIYKIDLKEIQ